MVLKGLVIKKEIHFSSMIFSLAILCTTDKVEMYFSYVLLFCSFYNVSFINLLQDKVGIAMSC